MSSKRYRVIQWATGNTGQRALREVIRHPSLDLVGVKVYSDDKNGTDAGELCGEEPTGVTATMDRDAVLALDADCVIYMPRATGHGPTRAGLTEDEVVDDAVALLGSGTNMVTTVTDFFARGVRMSDANRARVLDACKNGQSSVWVTGSDPGWVTETLPFALLSLQRRIDLIEIEEFGDLSYRPSPHMVMEQMGFGQELDESRVERRRAHLFNEYRLTLSVLADAAGFTIDEWTAAGGMAAARHDTTITSGEIKAGTVGAQKVVVTGRSGGADVLRFTQYAYVTMDVEPHWDLRPVGWRVQVHGDAPFDVSMPFPVPPEDIAFYVPAYNANGPVNAIPYVCAAPPGILTTADLPPMLPSGPRTDAT